MPSRSKQNKGKKKGMKKRVQETPHEIIWNKVKSGPSKAKHNKEFWKHL